MEVVVKNEYLTGNRDGTRTDASVSVAMTNSVINTDSYNQVD